ncbi:hypothetical protein PP175_15260 [Aneurinibacillus sp. Ricciae_BoGa-3]|uniref:hypothetical protein n=1 Tax=Aneurinibacillus sp. Ricciae_BoGa-3 TaxID=3022697 RepID=UPI0023413B44|nr:hypothetical protein [Aneurinibacillus sp. Ricciae_BoGa-3]WCK52782.1 hypothetical protein PP175_15260 [Aneurinibacillus sp. Ricciae_BoGa-3]
MALEEPYDQDIIEEIDGIRIAIDPMVHSTVQDAELDYTSSHFGGGFQLNGGNTSAC